MRASLFQPAATNGRRREGIGRRLTNRRSLSRGSSRALEESRGVVWRGRGEFCAATTAEVAVVRGVGLGPCSLM